jgi:ring-1,2-phenylacetyl-CoA epoxidase subunit PaaC
MLATVENCLRLGDTCLIWSQRLSEWSAHGPQLEEDIALSNIALDLLGQARYLLSHAGLLEGQGRDEDALAYWRESADYRNFSLAEIENGDYAQTMLRTFLLSTWFALRWQDLTQSSEPQLAAIAAKALKETSYHQRHSAAWVVRFGDGTEESRSRLEQALQRLWPYTAELFDDDAVDRELAASAVQHLPSSLQAAWLKQVEDVLTEATLSLPKSSAFLSEGKRGLHTEQLSFILAEMQSVTRAHPGAQW